MGTKSGSYSKLIKPVVGLRSGEQYIHDAVRSVIEEENVKVTSIGDLRLPQGCAEAQRCSGIRDILADYAERQGVESPLSIAVFGPPGSGKSRGVTEILKSLKPKFLPKVEINLSQFSEPRQLAAAIKRGFDQAVNDGVAGTLVFFFDEFDAALNNTSLGWLRWFLAPMQDGKIYLDGDPFKIRKAVFMFAGGTGATLEEFQERAKLDPATYRDQKVPDFISRLRGFIDVQGVNSLNADHERTDRRALLLRYMLDKRWPKARDAKGVFPIEPALVESLLSSVHFLHGVRSMEAVLDMSSLQRGSVQLPPDLQMRALHLSSGPLDGKVIGISTGQEDPESELLLNDLTVQLLRKGAILAYGGDFTPASALERVVEAAELVACGVLGDGPPLVRNYLGYPSYNNARSCALRGKWGAKVDFKDLETLSRSECEALGITADEAGDWFHARPFKGSPDKRGYDKRRHLAWAVSLFRMRVRLVQDIHALIVIGGKDGESWGRFSGIAEEVMLAVALGKPVYVMGGRGGGAREVGRLLSLGETIANPANCLDNGDLTDPYPDEFTDAFKIPGCDLPQTLPAVRQFLFDHSATDERRWPWNGLTLEENRRLFRTPVSHAGGYGDCVNLIVKGLCRLEWKPSKAKT